MKSLVSLKGLPRVGIGTSNCIKCGETATLHTGHVLALEKMALGNLVEVKIIAGWCSDEHYDSTKSNWNGCYGEYDNEKHGNVIKIF